MQQNSFESSSDGHEDYDMYCAKFAASSLEPPAAGIASDEKVKLEVDVCLKERSTASTQEVKKNVEDFLSTQQVLYRSGPVPFRDCDNAFLCQHVESISILCDHTGVSGIREGTQLLFWQASFEIYVFQLSEEGAADADEGEEGVSSYREYELPAREFHGLYDSLIYDGDIKQRLLTYAATALFFSDHKVDPQLISFNRTALLHGPPGTGKTSMCKALAQHLSVRFAHRYKHSQLIEVNAHSLFSKYFSESGKLVSRLFATIQEQVEDKDTLVFVLIDEVESLTAARQSAVSGNEPADAIRAVNSLLTQLDALKMHSNVMILTTSNITEAIDLAFVDRADIKAFIGPPSWKARYEILRSCLLELQRKGILDATSSLPPPFADAMQSCVACDPADACNYPVVTATAAGGISVTSELIIAALESEGMSGRTLRKLPFLAYAGSYLPHKANSSPFHLATALKQAVMHEKHERSLIRPPQPG